MKITSFVYAMLMAGTTANQHVPSGHIDEMRDILGENERGMHTVHRLMQADSDFENSKHEIEADHFNQLRKDMQDHLTLFQSQGVVCATQAHADCMIANSYKRFEQSWSTCAAQAGCTDQQLTEKNRGELAARLNQHPSAVAEAIAEKNKKMKI